jgi:hypothetical protein
MLSGPRRHTKGQILHDSTYTRHLEWVKPYSTESRIVSRVGRRRKWGAADGSELWYDSHGGTELWDDENGQW